MTTPTTPAADSFDAWYEALPSMAMPEREFALFVWNAATARESALIAERDALLIAGDDLANCAYNLAQRSGEVLSARSAVALDNARRKWDAVLSAPAVEGV